MDSFQEYLTELPPVVTYLALLVSTIAENIFPPFPGDTVTLVAAYMVGTGALNIWMTYAVTTLGSLTGFYALYILGRLYGRRYFHRKNFRYFNRETIRKVEDLFRRRGVLLIAINRFLSGLRAVVSLVAGITKYDWHVVLGLGFVSCVLWNGAIIYAGSTLGENWTLVESWMQRFNILVFIAAGSLVLIWAYLNLYLPTKAGMNSKDRLTES